MQTVVITGADRGLGREFARQYAAEGWSVVAACREEASFADYPADGSIELESLDVSQPFLIEAFAGRLKGRAVDLLINNAGMIDPPDTTIFNVDPERWVEVFRINAIAPLLVARSLLPNLSRSSRPTAATMGSQGGIPKTISDASIVMYKSSKAAAHAVAVVLSHALKAHGITYVSLRPGMTRTAMGGENAPFTVEDSVARLRLVLARITLKDSGLYLDRDGQVLRY